MKAKYDPLQNINSLLINTSFINFLALPLFNITYAMRAKVFRQDGDLKYEYNPFRNVFSEGEKIIEDNVLTIKEKGKLKDFRTTKLGFNLNNPVDITVQPSYDGTVNLILNDDKNPPRLINSRFTTLEDLRYTIVDRRGNNDTNIYREENMSSNTRLFKTTENISYIEFKGLTEGGALPAGNYVFYLKYSDADGNESDIIAESGIISCHLGKLNDPSSIRGGLINENSGKIIKLDLKNIDNSYDYVNIYFSRTTGDYSKEPISKFYKLNSKKSITNEEHLEIVITGLDNITEISIDQLNIQYHLVDKVKTQAQIQNMLFLANVDKPTVPYKELEDLSLRIYPTVDNSVNIGHLNHKYEASILSDQLDDYEYYNVKNVYNYTGYWNKEIYRLGVVYILNDDSLSPVFNIRGVNNLGKIVNAVDFENKISKYYTHKPLYDSSNNRIYIETDEEGFILGSSKDLENSKGTIRINFLENNIITNDGVYPLSVDLNIENEVLEEIRKYAKGMFFVRQKRIPTILAQGITIGVDEISNLPTIRANVRTSQGNKQVTYFTESFIDKSRLLTHNFSSRVINSNNSIRVGGILSPEAILKNVFFNNLFTGSNFNLSLSSFNTTNEYFEQDEIENRHFYIKNYSKENNPISIKQDVKLTLIEDNQPLKYSGTKRFSTRAGIPEEAWRTSFFSQEDRSSSSTSLVRGSFCGFVGQEGFLQPTKIVDIHISGYSLSNMRDYFLVRFNLSDAFYSVSNRYDFRLIDEEVQYYKELTKEDNHLNFKIYRGDCFINNVTMRIQRNFQDPDVPISNTIIDSLSWKDNYKGFSQTGAIDNEDLNKINRNDVNAIEIGHWVTFRVCSNINLAFRTIDESNSSEFALTGNTRSFYPFSSMSTKGENKIPESTLFNAGYNSTLTNKLYFGIPEVPFIKNIFDTRIMFSDIHITDAFRNGYRIFQGLSYKDVTRQYGGIVKIFEMKSNLLTIFERGVGIFPINEKAVVNAGETGDIFIKGAGVLPEKPNVLSDTYGSYWQDSIVRTKRFIYGVDTISKKIWRTDGESFEVISDFKIQTFLNQNIELSEDDKKPMIGLKNVKTHYNAFKEDLIFTFYDSTKDDKDRQWSICYNEDLDLWITRYSWIPLSSENINKVFFSFDRTTGRKLALPGYTNFNNEESIGITLIGKEESFDKLVGSSTITRTNPSGINIIDLNDHLIGTFKMKGYEYYEDFILKYVFNTSFEDYQYFRIDGDKLYWKEAVSFTKMSFELMITVQLYSNLNGQEILVSQFDDLLGVKVSRNYIWKNNTQEELDEYDAYFSTWFWKHGQAGLFDIQTEILPTKWYDKQETFEFEYVFVDNPNLSKIVDNLKIISNNAEPDSFIYTISKDNYKLSNFTDYDSVNYKTFIEDETIKNYQKVLDMKTEGRLRGNTQYLENFWKIEVSPLKFNHGDLVKESKLRDKYCIIRAIYKGNKLNVITALQTLYTISYT